MIQECPVNLECKLIKVFSIQNRQIFVREVAQAYIAEDSIIESDGHRRITDI